MATYFLSDTHLTTEQPEVYDKFIRYLGVIQDDADELYILGDLFDYWIGDDGVGLLGHSPAVEALASISASGTKVAVMHGNRDFLIGQEFIGQIGASLLSDPSTIVLNDHQTVLLMHGDSLCTDDVAHQRYRRTVLTPEWQEAILASPVLDRLTRAKDMRATSEQNKQTKSMSLMDVNESAVVQAMEEHQVNILIHGHTHRPGIHKPIVNGIEGRRYVLGDWGRENDAVIRVDSSGEFDLHHAVV